MLTYLSGGERRYAEVPVRSYARPYWEFQAVHAGVIAPTFPSELSLFCEYTLWVFSPGLEHGWTGIEGNRAEISVFHFDGLSEPAASFIRKQGDLRVTLETQALDRIAALREECAAVINGKDPLAVLKFEAASLELAILALSTLNPARTAPLLNRAELVAAGADAWYLEHIEEGPSVAAVARRMNCSVSHFRRLYREARGCSPAESFEALRLGRARQLLSRGLISVKEVSALCGYESQSCFSRAFKRTEGRAPRNFRL